MNSLVRKLNVGAVLACLLFVTGASRADDLSLSISNYWNRVYDPAPAAIPVVSNHQAKSVAFFNGNVGPRGGSNTPTDGTFYLVRSAFGHALGPAKPADFLFGEDIVPDPALGVNLAIAPLIEPAARAFFVTNALNPLDEHRLIAAEPGFVTITWFTADLTPRPVRYFISDRPVRSPVSAYHTHLGTHLTNSPNASPQPPPISLGTVPITMFHWNSAIPENVADPFLYRSAAHTLFSKEKIGRILLEYRNSQSQFLSVEIVAVKANEPDGLTAVHIGSQLLPLEDAGALVEMPTVSRGSDVFVYEHNSPGSPQNGDLFAIRKTLHPAWEDIEVYWRRRGLQGVIWPYELHRYRADWPLTAPAKYQLYVRGGPQVLGPNVVIDRFNFDVMEFQEPASHAHKLPGDLFTTDVAGWSLLKYSPSNAVIFQVVRSVLHDDAAFFNLASTPRRIGLEITEPTHQGPRPGYIHVPEGDRYDWEIYDGRLGDPVGFRTQQIFPVNTGLLEVWWANLNQGVQWPSLVKRYLSIWPAGPEKIIIASMLGSGAIDPVTHRNFRIYFQNEATLAGYNPNDEHALIRPSGMGEAAFALRNDLGTPATSQPYLLLKFQQPALGDRWGFRVFQVLAEGLGSDGTNYTFTYPATAGTLIQPPFPLSSFQTATNSHGVSGPYWRDRKDGLYARAAGDDGGTSNIVMRFFYKVQPGFFFPGANPPGLGEEVPWLDLYAQTPGTPARITYVSRWPDTVPILAIGETLVKTKKNLPAVGDMDSAEIIYQQSIANGIGESVKLIDPTRIHEAPLALPPGDVQTGQSRGLYFFTTLPPHLRQNFWHDPTEQKLKFVGSFIEPVAGEYYLRLNVITARERTVLLNLSQEPAFRTAVATLSASASQVIEVPPNTPFDSLALTAGLAKGGGYVTIAENNSTNLNAPAAQVKLHIIRVACPLYRGEIKAILSDNPLDEKLTLRHSGDFAGKADDYIFEWRTEPPVGGLPSTKPYASWSVYFPNPPTGEGAGDITIEGAGLYTLTDNYFVCRYRPR